MCDHHMGAHEFLRSPQPPGPPCTDMAELHKKWQWQVRARAAWPHIDLVTRVHTLKCGGLIGRTDGQLLGAQL